jgi:tRNA/tmRNA/rRNA uracil-C5-methylase (TrmA/RlmC/RlmD family)
MRWAIDADGRPCLHAHRSRDLIPIDDCPASASGIRAWLAGAPRLHGEQALTAEGDPVQVSVDGQVVAGPGRVPRRVRHRTWRIAADTFWQAHPALPDALVDSVLEFGRPASGEHWWDLYAGAGLFSAFLGEAVGPTGGVDAVEGSGSAVRDARRALHDLPWVRLHRQSVRSWMRHASGSPDGVVLDPPRSGAGAEVLGPLSALRPSRIILVACDPVALGRDVGLLADAGYRLERLRAFDAFAMTHHLEAVASLIASDGAHRLT